MMMDKSTRFTIESVQDNRPEQLIKNLEEVLLKIPEEFKNTAEVFYNEEGIEVFYKRYSTQKEIDQDKLWHEKAKENRRLRYEELKKEFEND